MNKKPQRETALRVFAAIMAHHSALRMTLEEAPANVDVALSIPIQPGLCFDIHLNLQWDELHLCAGEGFWLEWFPCTDPLVVDRFVAAVNGLLDGTYRILEYRSNAKYLRGYLQESHGATWKTVGRSQRGWVLPWQRQQETVLHNIAA